MSDVMDLYSRRLLALAADIPHLGRIDNAPSATRRSPQCGSEVTAFCVVKDGVIAEFAQEVRACALGQASAAILGQTILGRTPADITKACDALSSMLNGGPVPASPFDGLEALLPARDFTNRHASILLAWQAAAEAAQK